MEVSLSQYGSDVCTLRERVMEGRQEMREERRMKMKEGKWDGERGGEKEEGAQK